MKTLLAAGLLAACISTSALADCPYPKPPNDKIPDGSNAQKEELVAASRAVKEYIVLVDSYQECIEKELATNLAKPDATEEQKASWTTMAMQKRDASQTEKEAIGLRMNEQIKAYNVKQKEKKGS